MAYSEPKFTVTLMDEICLLRVYEDKGRFKHSGNEYTQVPFDWRVDNSKQRFCVMDIAVGDEWLREDGTINHSEEGAVLCKTKWDAIFDMVGTKQMERALRIAGATFLTTNDDLMADQFALDVSYAGVLETLFAYAANRS